MELIAQAAVEFVERNSADLAFCLLEALRRHAEQRLEWVEMYNVVLGAVQAVVKRQRFGVLPLRSLDV